MTPAEIEKLPYRPCVGVVVLNEKGRIFAATRIDSSADAWQMPQGGIDDGEEPQAAALRELEEETGIPANLVDIVAESADWIPYDLPHDLVPKLWKGRFRGQMQKWFLLRFHGNDDNINIETETPEFTKWAWMEASEIYEKIVPFKQKTYAAVFAAFEDYLD